jgi:hypothetical protein
MTTKKPTESKASQEQSVAATPSPEEVLARYMDAVKALDLMRQQLEASGVKLETPPTEPGVVRESVPVAQKLPDIPLPAPEVLAKVKPGQAIEGTYRPWTKSDLAGEEKHQLVPQFIPGAVHPIKDQNGKFHIFMDVNGLQCSLVVHEINYVSGMFFHAYKNIEQAWRDSEEFKAKGPINAPWVAGGLHGTNTWAYQGEAPAPWINIDGGYYKPGDPMPLDDLGEVQ